MQRPSRVSLPTRPLSPAARRFFRSVLLRLERTLRKHLAHVPPDHVYFCVDVTADFGPRDERGILFIEMTSLAEPAGRPLRQVSMEIPQQRLDELREGLARFNDGKQVIH